MKMMKVALLIIFWMQAQSGISQVLMQLEIFKEVKAIKYYPGDVIHYKVKQFPKDWRQSKIERILFDEKMLITNDGLVKLEDITEFRVYKPNVYALGLRLIQAGVVWWTYGAIIHIFTENKFTWSTFAIGATAAGIGFILKKWVSRRTFKIKKNANLRILDVSFPTPDQINPKRV
ncbi:MAG: hypothetical protein IPM26_15865 [Saprospiraceae bacterium]|nr:hypothetical protein [Saprospiraceae bacterium]